MTTATVKLPDKLVDLFGPGRGQFRYRVAYGGRGSGKSFSFALMAAIWGYVEPLRILCTRELQISIKESMHAEIKNAIQSTPWLADHYEVGADFIRGRNGTQFMFRGLRHNISAIKSMAQIDLCIVEEAEDIPHTSWRDLIPTVRAPGSEFWVVFNPKRRDSWVAEQFITGTPPPRASIVRLNFDGNPYFPRELDEQRRHDQETLDPALYRHVWEGEFYEQSDAQVFAGKWRFGEFEPEPTWDGPYYGLDFGFSQDPTAGTKSWVNDGRLYIEHELYEKRLELDSTSEVLKSSLPGVERYAIRADNARPESISYLKRHGIPRIEPCRKGKGSVADGVEFIRSFREVIIHPRCKNTADEFSLYSYKLDRLSGDVLPTIIDAHNHAIDSLRYALEPIMRKRTTVGMLLPGARA